jgi:hypothetical protein
MEQGLLMQSHMFVSARFLVVIALSSALSACGSEKEDRLPPADSGVVEPDTGVDSGVADSGETPDAGEELDSGTLDSGEVSDLRDRLLSIEGLDVEELFAPIPGTRAFALKLRQPEDHRSPDGASFKQRLVLVHRDERAPMVLQTTGYGLFGNPALWTELLSEPTAALEANQITVEHRFFGESIAREANWAHLNIEQSANDSHRIVALLSAIYQGPWVGTGVSKGGMTAIFHHRFFPEDLAAIVPYVAPISFGVNDARYLDWVAQIGPTDGICRERVKDMAVELIERRAEMAQHFIATDPIAAAFRPEVLEALVTFPAFSWHWGFWQGLGSPEWCAAVPPRNDAVGSLALWFPFYPEYALGYEFDPEVSPYGYQVSNELGAQAIDDSHLEAALADVDFSVLPQVPPMPPPWGFEPTFDPLPIMGVDAFLRNDASHVLGVYGAWDPWSGGIITVNEANDSEVLLVPEIGHAAQIAMLPEEQQNEALDRLDRWLGRSTLVAPDWSRARARMREHQADHQLVVRRALELDRRMAVEAALRERPRSSPGW